MEGEYFFFGIGLYVVVAYYNLRRIKPTFFFFCSLQNQGFWCQLDKWGSHRVASPAIWVLSLVPWHWCFGWQSPNRLVVTQINSLGLWGEADPCKPRCASCKATWASLLSSVGASWQPETLAADAGFAQWAHSLVWYRFPYSISNISVHIPIVSP